MIAAAAALTPRSDAGFLSRLEESDSIEWKSSSSLLQ
jgi:hypothetical protein